MGGPFRDYSQITVYHPDPEYGHAFINIGFTGFIGSLTGVSATQLGISEIGVSYPDATFGTESRIGVPFIFLLRDILQYDYTLDDATNRMINTRRTCDLILGVGDGKLGYFSGYEYSYSVLNVFNPLNMEPYNQTWHPRIPNIVYWGMVCSDLLAACHSNKSRIGFAPATTTSSRSRC
jgi:isopenicillin-N N-acyltransferase-like protein